MPRSLTFGYNAIACFDPLIINRLLEGRHSRMDLRETFSWPVVVPSGLIPIDGFVHALIRSPKITLDPEDTRKNAVLHLDDTLICFNFTTPPPSSCALSQTVADISIEFSLTWNQTLQQIMPDFSDMGRENIRVECDPDRVNEGFHCRPGVPGIYASLIKEMLFNQLTSEDSELSVFIANLGTEIDIEGKAFLSDGIDLKILNTVTADQGESINFALYDQFRDETHGDNDDITNILRPDKSFSVAISRALFEELLSRHVYLNFTTYAESEEAPPRGIRISISEDGKVILSGQPFRDIVFEGRATNLATGETINFESDPSGMLNVIINASPSELINIEGIALHRNLKGVSIRIPFSDIHVSLLEGTIRIEAETLINSDTEILAPWLAVSIELNYRPYIDPVTGRFSLNMDIDHEIVDGSFFIYEISTFFDSIFDIDKWIERELNSMGVSMLGNFVSDLTELNLPGIHLFLEEFEVLPNGLILSGQADAGNIARAGIQIGIGITGLQFDFGRSTLRGPLRIQRIDSTFEETGLYDLAELRMSSSSATLPVPAGGREAVYAYETFDNLGKLRIHILDSGTPVVRFIEYRKPIAPNIIIQGTWEGTGSPFIERPRTMDGVLMKPHGADRYAGHFELSWTRLLSYPADPGALLNVVLEMRYSGYGDGEDYVNLNRSVQETEGEKTERITLEVNVDTTAFGGSEPGDFRFDFNIRASDIFGRSASTFLHLEGSSFYFSVVPPERAKEPFWDRRGFPESKEIRPGDGKTQHKGDKESEESKKDISQKINELSDRISALEKKDESILILTTDPGV